MFYHLIASFPAKRPDSRAPAGRHSRMARRMLIVTAALALLAGGVPTAKALQATAISANGKMVLTCDYYDNSFNCNLENLSSLSTDEVSNTSIQSFFVGQGNAPTGWTANETINPDDSVKIDYRANSALTFLDQGSINFGVALAAYDNHALPPNLSEAPLSGTLIFSARTADGTQHIQIAAPRALAERMYKIEAVIDDQGGFCRLHSADGQVDSDAAELTGSYFSYDTVDFTLTPAADSVCVYDGAEYIAPHTFQISKAAADERLDIIADNLLRVFFTEHPNGNLTVSRDGVPLQRCPADSCSDLLLRDGSNIQFSAVADQYYQVDNLVIGGSDHPSPTTLVLQANTDFSAHISAIRYNLSISRQDDAARVCRIYATDSSGSDTGAINCGDPDKGEDDCSMSAVANQRLYFMIESDQGSCFFEDTPTDPDTIHEMIMPPQETVYTVRGTRYFPWILFMGVLQYENPVVREGKEL
jgi:hypothetical protein